MASALPLPLWISVAKATAFSEAFEYVNATPIFCCISLRTMSAPMPRDPPVTRATRCGGPSRVLRSAPSASAVPPAFSISATTAQRHRSASCNYETSRWPQGRRAQEAHQRWPEAESPRARKNLMDHTSAIVESDGEHVEKSIGKPAHPGRLGSRQVA
jgi:hypothetical protein